MKTIIITTAIVLASVIGINKNTYAATTNKDAVVSTTLTDIKSISKIEVYGNVELYVSDGPADQVKVYNQYYKESALIQDQKGVLRISSYGAQKLVVWVTASDLRSLAIYDNAEVRSFGKLSAIELNVALYNNASAQLDMDAFSASITLNDHAKANLTGNVEEGELKYSKTSFLNTTNLAAVKVTKTISVTADKNNTPDDLVSL
jgi:hypothetical protein